MYQHARAPQTHDSHSKDKEKHPQGSKVRITQKGHDYLRGLAIEAKPNERLDKNVTGTSLPRHPANENINELHESVTTQAVLFVLEL